MGEVLDPDDDESNELEDTSDSRTLQEEDDYSMDVEHHHHGHANGYSNGHSSNVNGVPSASAGPSSGGGRPEDEDDDMMT